MILGRVDIMDSPLLLTLDADTKQAARFHLPEIGVLSRISVYLDGQGSGVGDQSARAGIYDVLGNLIAESDDVTVADGQAQGWVDFPITSLLGRVILPVGDYYLAVQAGASTDTIRLYGSDPHGQGGKYGVDSFADGLSDPFGSSSVATSDFAAFALVSSAYMAPQESDIYYSRLPLAEAQGQFALSAPVSRSGIVSTCTWHSTFQDSETGSNALVRDGSDLFDLLGKRIKVSTQGREVETSVYAYVHDVFPAGRSDSTADLSVTRLLFSRLGNLAQDQPVLIEEVS